MLKFSPLLVGIALLVSCVKSETDKPGSIIIKKNTSVISPKMNQEVTIGDGVSFVVNSEGPQIDSVVVSGKDFSEKFDSGSFNWTPLTNRTGRFNFKITVYSQDKSETHYPRLKMLSDVIPEEMTYAVVNSFPHDENDFTQGLFFLENHVIESTGQKGESVIKKVQLSSGQVIKTTPIGEEYFGEGSTLYNGEIYMLTWMSGIGFVFDTELNLLRNFQINYEGWGLTALGDTLLMTIGNGTKGFEKIILVNPSNFSEIDQLEVYNHEGPVSNLNELEVVDELLYANEWQTNNIHIIDPMTGKVLKTIDCTGLLTDEESRDAGELNGIAYQDEAKRLIVTGKNWPKIFEITIKPKTNVQ